ncbi:MAG: hypothetical protein IPL84_16765 [Chitinophagaceae bacterium]|nr:hypothetical protein [Chitinophagaceae bacterium]
MKNLIILGFLVLLLVLVQFAQAQTVDEVINKHIDALGGKENLNKVQNMVMEGSLSYQGTDVAMSFTQVDKKLYRQDIDANGMHGFNMITDTDGWSYMPFFGMSAPEPVSADEVKENQSDLDISGPLVDYVAKGHKAELMPKETVNGNECHKIKMVLASGKTMYFLVDVSSFLISRTIDMRKVNGQTTDTQTDYSDYKDVEGVKMAHSITGQYGTTYISGIKINQTIPESAFKHDM